LTNYSNEIIIGVSMKKPAISQERKRTIATLSLLFLLSVLITAAVSTTNVAPVSRVKAAVQKMHTSTTPTPTPDNQQK
jgi:hypothetical protein